MRDRLHTYFEEEERARAEREGQGLMGTSFARAAMAAGVARRQGPRLAAVQDGIKVSSGIAPYYRHYTRVAGSLGRERIADKSRVARAFADRSASEDYGRFVMDEDAKMMRMRDKGLFGRKVFRDIDEFERLCGPAREDFSGPRQRVPVPAESPSPWARHAAEATKTEPKPQPSPLPQRSRAEKKRTTRPPPGAVQEPRRPWSPPGRGRWGGVRVGA